MSANLPLSETLVNAPAASVVTLQTALPVVYRIMQMRNGGIADRKRFFPFSDRILCAAHALTVPAQDGYSTMSVNRQPAVA